MSFPTVVGPIPQAEDPDLYDLRANTQTFSLSGLLDGGSG